jgi:hypothetical protein
MSQGLDIVVDWDGNQVTQASVTIRRLSGASLLLGRSADEVIDWIPRLYSLCGKAQTAAARLALAAARRDAVPVEPAVVRAIVSEQAQEHLWRLLRDWPPLLGVAPRDADLALWFRRLARADTAVGAELLVYIEQVLLDMPVDNWLGIPSVDALGAWATASSAHAAQLVTPLLRSPSYPTAIRCLDPALRAADFADASWDADFARSPVWRGAPAETGAYARRRAHPLVQLGGDGLLARLLARLVDLIAVARQLSGADAAAFLADAVTVADNIGLSRVDTARGTLMHRVELADDKVVNYVVVAPTEWNFHPCGGFVSAVAKLRCSDADELRRQVSRWVVAYDPCVDWRMELRRA